MYNKIKMSPTINEAIIIHFYQCALSRVSYYKDLRQGVGSVLAKHYSKFILPQFMIKPFMSLSAFTMSHSSNMHAASSNFSAQFYCAYAASRVRQAALSSPGGYVYERLREGNLGIEPSTSRAALALFYLYLLTSHEQYNP